MYNELLKSVRELIHTKNARIGYLEYIKIDLEKKLEAAEREIARLKEVKGECA